MVYLPDRDSVPEVVQQQYSSNEAAFPLNPSFDSDCVSMGFTSPSVIAWCLKLVGIILFFCRTADIPQDLSLMLIFGCVCIGLSLLVEWVVFWVNFCRSGTFLAPNTAAETREYLSRLRHTLPSTEITIECYHTYHTTDSKGHSHSHRRVTHTATVTVPFDYCVDLISPRPLDFAHGLIFLKLQTEFYFGDAQTNARIEQMRTSLVEENKGRDKEHRVWTTTSLPGFKDSNFFVGDSTRLPGYLTKKWFFILTLLGWQAPYLLLVNHLCTTEKVVFRKVMFSRPF